jgi:hypothetical protein
LRKLSFTGCLGIGRGGLFTDGGRRHNWDVVIYETRLKEQATADHKRAAHDLQLIQDLQDKLLREQDRVVHLQRKLLAIRDLFRLDGE